MSALPVYITTDDVARLLGWSTQRATDWLKRENAVIKRAGRWVTTPERLRSSFPEVWDRLLEEKADREAREGDSDQ